MKRVFLCTLLLLAVLSGKGQALPDALREQDITQRQDFPQGREGFSSSFINDSVRSLIVGKSYPYDCAIPLSDLRYLKVRYYDYQGYVRYGELICNALIADDLLDIFYRLFLSEYQIANISLIDEYGADDNESMEANNTSCFNYRKATNSSKLSLHARGLAIDINPVENPYIKNGVILPANGKAYSDRSTHFSHKIDRDDLCYRLFKEKGFVWGGEWRTVKDYQHFEKQM